MAEQNKYTEYTLADIERYLKGQMNAREMHDIELAALQDPFLSDAIEGYNAASFPKSYAHLNEIEAMLTGQKEQARVIVMPEKKRGWINIAAGFILLAGAGTAFWLLNGHNNKADALVAQQEVAGAQAQVQAADTTRPLAQATPLQKAVTEYKAVNDAAKSKKAKPVNSVVLADANSSGDLSPSVPRVNATDSTAVVYNLNASTESKQPLSPNVDKEYFLKDSTKIDANAIAGRVNGLVVNNATDNNLYSNVASPKGPLTPNTQLNKQFDGNLNKAFDVQTDSVHSAGRQGFATNFREKNKTEQLKRAAQPSANTPITNLQVTLTPSPTFDTVAVTYLNNKNYSRKLVADSSLFPQGGWESFRDYVYRKLHKEIDTTEALAYGDVEVEFTVDELGNARNLKITKSLNKQSDAEAIELVRQWPGWIAGKKQKKGKVVIQF